MLFITHSSRVLFRCSVELHASVSIYAVVSYVRLKHEKGYELQVLQKSCHILHNISPYLSSMLNIMNHHHRYTYRLERSPFLIFFGNEFFALRHREQQHETERGPNDSTTENYTRIHHSTDRATQLYIARSLYIILYVFYIVLIIPIQD